MFGLWAIFVLSTQSSIRPFVHQLLLAKDITFLFCCRLRSELTNGPCAEISSGFISSKGWIGTCSLQSDLITLPCESGSVHCILVFNAIVQPRTCTSHRYLPSTTAILILIPPRSRAWLVRTIDVATRDASGPHCFHRSCGPSLRLARIGQDPQLCYSWTVGNATDRFPSCLPEHFQGTRILAWHLVKYKKPYICYAPFIYPISIISSGTDLGSVVVHATIQ